MGAINLAKRAGKILLKGRKLYAVILAILTLYLTIMFFMKSMHFRFSFSPPSMDQLANGVDENYQFKSKSLRMLAERIYHHRAVREFNPADYNKYIGIFTRLNRDSSPPEIDENTKDVFLYRMANAPLGQFTVMLSYRSIFNHDRYVECLQAYDKKTRSFRGDIRGVVIKSVLGIEVPDIGEISNSVRNCLARVQSQYEPPSATTTMAIPKDSVRFTSSDKLILLVIDTYSDEDLYKLLIRGYIGSQ